MKTRYSIYGFAALVALAASCEPNLNLNLPNEKIGFSTTEAVNEVSVFAQGYDLAIIKSGKGNSTATVKIDLCSAEDFDRINAADTLHDYVFADPSSYSLPEVKEFTFDEKDYRKVAKVSWTVNSFFNKNNGKDAVIPVAITECSADLDTARKVVFIKPFISEISFTLKDMKTLFPNPDELTKDDVFTGVAQLGIDRAVPADIDITLSLDTKGVEEEIARRLETTGKEYIVAPKGLLTLDNSVVTLAKGDLFASFKYNVNYSILFNESGKLAYEDTKMLTPVKILSISPEGIGTGEMTVTYLVVDISESGIVIRPSDPSEDFTGPWDVLEGEENDMAHDPACPDKDWYGHYSVDKLVDGNFYNPYDGNKVELNNNMGLWFWTPNQYPLNFVFDLEDEYIFNGFRLVDSRSHQNQCRHIRVYTAKSYAGGDTVWTLACEGTRTFNGGWQKWPEDNGSKESLDANFTYHMPEDSLPEDNESDPPVANYFKLTKGRYLRLELVEPSRTEGEYEGGRAYLIEFYINGWKL